MSPIKLRTIFAPVAALLLSVTALPAQRNTAVPKRPKLATLADTNDARAYSEFAMDAFERDPDASAAGFYWATRIDPTMAGAFYGRRAALILGNKSTLTTYMAGSSKRSQSKDIRALDSLYLHALMIDPFLYTRLDKRMFTYYLRTSVQQSSRLSGNGEVQTPELNFYIDQWLRASDNETRGWIAYNDGDFAKALDFYRDALRNTKNKAGLHAERGRIFALRGGSDSAIAEFTLALDELRKRDTKELVVLYNSKAVLEHSIGELLVHANSLPAAREAYGRALQEDLSYYPAHIRLGLLAFAANDTANALSELDLAAQIAPNEPVVHYQDAIVLAKFGKAADAMQHLKKAIELEPYYAKPYSLLGQLLDQGGDKAGAIATYDRFLSLDSKADADRAVIVRRRTELANGAN